MDIIEKRFDEIATECTSYDRDHYKTCRDVQSLKHEFLPKYYCCDGFYEDDDKCKGKIKIIDLNLNFDLLSFNCILNLYF